MASVLESSEEKIYGFKLMRLIVDGGTEALRNVFLSIHPGILHNVLATHYLTLYHLKTTRIITQPQWNKLYPHPPMLPNIQEFDITLLVVLLRNICGLSPPSSGWNVSPSSSDNSREANIVRVRLFRNHFFGHVPGTGVSRLDFESRWADVSSALRGLGLRQASIDRLKAEKCGEEEVNRVQKEWSESEKEIMSKLDRFETMLKKDHALLHESLKQAKSFSVKVLRDCLDWCDFKSEIELLYENYTEGTREWVFQPVSTWLNDATSDNRAFIISGQAGMGKSTIAAVLSKRFPENFAACHFFQYNDSRYNNPNIFLQSLAWQLSNVVPEYKQNLTSKLCGGKGKKLHDQNIEGMFSTLFKEPFTNIPDPGKYFLIVIDALDECRQQERYELVDLIAKKFYKFPKFIKFLVTTRSERDIANKFHKLNPLFLQPEDEHNLNDLRLFFEDKLKATRTELVFREEVIKALVGKSEGSMLCASFLCKLSENRCIKTNVESLPKGIEEICESYFDRLETELRNFGISKEMFLSFLSVIAVAKKPLPLPLIEKLLSSEKGSMGARKTFLRSISCNSSLLVIKDNSVSFFHKSVKDWLVKRDHPFTISEEWGHKTLAAVSINKMETLKQNEVTFTYDLATQYALQYGIPHMLQTEEKDIHCLAKLLSYATDLEIAHASVCIDVYATLNNLVSLEGHNTYSSFLKNTQRTIKTLISIIRKFTYILKGVPQSFLQHVVNECDVKLSPKASALLVTRFKNLAYFESEYQEESIERALVGRILTTSMISDVDVSPSEDFIVCGYSTGGVELFSLSDLKPLWKLDDIVETSPVYTRWKALWRLPNRRVVFHPLKNIIFPGQLNPVLNFEGKFESGPILYEKTPAKFTLCCFSHDNTKMATNHNDQLTVWNILDNKKIISLPCGSELFSVMFSANDKFIATTNIQKLCVYDTENSYYMTSQYVSDGRFHDLLSTFDSDSWYYCPRKENHVWIVNYNLIFKPAREYLNLLPGNTRAAAQYQAAMESGNLVWLNELGRGMFFILSNGIALVFRPDCKELKIYKIEMLFSSLNVKPKCGERRPPHKIATSVNGKYIYTSNLFSGLSYIFSYTHFSKSTKHDVQIRDDIADLVPVTNGVFCCRRNRDKCGGGGTPELWNSVITQRLSSFPELSGTFRCLSVADDLAACVMESQVCFFDVVKREIIARTALPKYALSSLSEYKSIVSVIACSSQYHVVMSKGKSILLLQGTIVIDLGSRVLNNIVPAVESITTACFSPNGKLLAFISDEKQLYILKMLTLNICCNYPLQSERVKLKFVDDDHLICPGYGDCLCLFSVKSREMLTYISVGMSSYQWRFAVCRKTGIIVVSDFYGETLKTIKVWLPYQRKDAKELVEC